MVSLALLFWIPTVGLNRKKEKYYLKSNFPSKREKHIKASGAVNKGANDILKVYRNQRAPTQS